MRFSRNPRPLDPDYVLFALSLVARFWGKAENVPGEKEDYPSSEKWNGSETLMTLYLCKPQCSRFFASHQAV